MMRIKNDLSWLYAIEMGLMKGIKRNRREKVTRKDT